MATIVNTPAAVPQDSSNGMGYLLTAVVLLVFGVLFFVYGLPAISNSMRSSSPSITVPEQIDVNVNQGQPE